MVDAWGKLNKDKEEPVFKIEASGSLSVSGKGKIHYDANSNGGSTDTETNASLELLIEASVTIGGGLLGFVFTGGDVTALVAENTYIARAEAWFTADFAQGVHFSKGMYVKAEIGFMGLTCVATKETKVDEVGKNSTKSQPYVIIPPKQPIMGDTYYFND